MKYILTEDEHKALSDPMKAEYKLGDDGYTLLVEGGEDTGALKRAKDHEKTRRQTAENKLKEVETSLTEKSSEYDVLLSERSSTAGLEKKWKDKLDAREAELIGEVGGLNSELGKLLIDNVADAMAASLSDSPGLLRPHIKSRLKVERVDGKATTRILDASGEVSPLTLDELKKEFSTNPEFAPVIRGSKASGSGAQGGGGGGGDTKKPDFSNSSTKEIADYLKSKKT